MMLDSTERPSTPRAAQTVSSSRARINEYLVEIDADPSCIQRPTEAQLRWAHFHRAQRVRCTKDRIDRLMQYPANASDVDGAHSSDGDTTVTEKGDYDEEMEVNSGGVNRHRSSRNPSSTAYHRSYLGMRKDPRTGKWVRRHCSQRRFPHLGERSLPPSPQILDDTSVEGNSRQTPNNGQSISTQQTSKYRSRRKVPISKGRRALLRVSARALEERKRQSIQLSREWELNAYVRPTEHDNPKSKSLVEEEEGVTRKSGRRKKSRQKVVFENGFDLDSFGNGENEKVLRLEDEISGLFTTRTGETGSRKSSSSGSNENDDDRSQSQRSLRRLRPGSSMSSYISIDDEERIRRFEMAYQAIMLASDAQHDDDEITVSTEWMNAGGKRWTRNPNVSSAISIDGRMYTDLQRTPTVPMKQMLTSPDCYDSKHGIFRSELHDRGATWMVHMPQNVPRQMRRDMELNSTKQPDVVATITRGRRREREIIRNRQVLSPCQKRLNDIETKIQTSGRNADFDLLENRKAVVRAAEKNKLPHRRTKDCSGVSLSLRGKHVHSIRGEQSQPQNLIPDSSQIKEQVHRENFVDAIHDQLSHQERDDLDELTTPLEQLGRCEDEHFIQKKKLCGKSNFSKRELSSSNVDITIKTRNALDANDKSARNNLSAETRKTFTSSKSHISFKGTLPPLEKSTESFGVKKPQSKPKLLVNDVKSTRDALESKKHQEINAPGRVRSSTLRLLFSGVQTEPARPQTGGDHVRMEIAGNSVGRDQKIARLHRDRNKNVASINTAKSPDHHTTLEKHKISVDQGHSNNKSRINGIAQSSPHNNGKNVVKCERNGSETSCVSADINNHLHHHNGEPGVSVTVMGEAGQDIDQEETTVLHGELSKEEDISGEDCIDTEQVEHQAKERCKYGIMAGSNSAENTEIEKNNTNHLSLVTSNEEILNVHDSVGLKQVAGPAEQKSLNDNNCNKSNSKEWVLKKEDTLDSFTDHCSEIHSYKAGGDAIAVTEQSLEDHAEPHLIDESRKADNSDSGVSLPQLNVADLVRESLALRIRDNSIIDTDGSESDVTGIEEELSSRRMRSMLMSPALITKRFQQARRAAEVRNWDQLSYLVSANPWLMEMKDVRNDQYLVHSLALFGGGQHNLDENSSTSAQPVPEQLMTDIMDHLPTVVQKLDNEGNLPLHMAAASGNVEMIRELGKRFSGAASVQNHDGLLPLHLAIMSCALFPTGEHAVELILRMFPGAVRVKDNDGNTPLHIAAGTLRGDIGVEIIYHIMDVSNEFIQNNPVVFPENVGHIKKPKDSDEEASVITASTEPPTDISSPDDSCRGSIFCLAKNNRGETPLTRAIKSSAGWQIVEALLNLNGGNLTALDKNSASQNALHLVLDSEFIDAAVVLSILKLVPSTAGIPDCNGNLPIQLACKNSLEQEVILAIAIVDLPIDLGMKEEAIVRNGSGASWWFLLCESDDCYVEIVKEILSLCSHPQKMALCFTRRSHCDYDNRTALACATPKCKMALRKSLRILNRFEFVGDETKNTATSKKCLMFDAIDYGNIDGPKKAKRRVTLICYTDTLQYSKDIFALQQSTLDPSLVEELNHFNVSEIEASIAQDSPLRWCVSVEKPKMTLARVVGGMPKHHEYRQDPQLLGRYFFKVKSVMHVVARAVNHLHENGIVHGSVNSHHIGKFGDDWKITGLLGSAAIGGCFSNDRLGLHSPPETFVMNHEDDSGTIACTTFNPSAKAEVAMDIWAFGKLIYEVLVGESLLKIFSESDETNLCSTFIRTWNNDRLKRLTDQLIDAHIDPTGIDLVSSCLAPRKEDRPDSMIKILRHPFWEYGTAES